MLEGARQMDMETKQIADGSKNKKQNKTKQKQKTAGEFMVQHWPCGRRIWSFAIQKDSRLRRMESCFGEDVLDAHEGNIIDGMIGELKCSTIGSFFFLWSLTLSDFAEANRV